MEPCRSTTSLGPASRVERRLRCALRRNDRRSRLDAPVRARARTATPAGFVAESRREPRAGLKTSRSARTSVSEDSDDTGDGGIRAASDERNANRSKPGSHLSAPNDRSKWIGTGGIRAESRREPRAGLKTSRSARTSESEDWRRERDSNPRNPSGLSGFQDHRHRPLGHLSASKSGLNSRGYFAPLAVLTRVSPPV